VVLLVKSPFSHGFPGFPMVSPTFLGVIASPVLLGPPFEVPQDVHGRRTRLSPVDVIFGSMDSYSDSYNYSYN
jgi:hypothetical protein